MTRKRVWASVGAVILCVLLLWWLYVAILVNEDVNEQDAQTTEQNI